MTEITPEDLQQKFGQLKDEIENVAGAAQRSASLPALSWSCWPSSSVLVAVKPRRPSSKSVASDLHTD